MRFSTVLTALKAAPRLGSTHFPPWVFLASHFRVENVHVQKTGPHAVQLFRKMPFLSFTPPPVSRSGVLHRIGPVRRFEFGS